MAKAVTTLPSEKWRIVARVAGGDEREIIWHPDTSELEIPGVTDTALGNALVQVESGTATATVEDKTHRIEVLASAARATIEGGFSSLAGGLHSTPKWYDSEIEDQLNLVGNVEVGDDTIHAYRSSQGSQDKVYGNHTNAQLRAVLLDGRDRKLAILQEFAAKKAQVLAATTQGELDAIVWP